MSNYGNVVSQNLVTIIYLLDRFCPKFQNKFQKEFQKESYRGVCFKKKYQTGVSKRIVKRVSKGVIILLEMKCAVDISWIQFSSCIGV